MDVQNNQIYFNVKDNKISVKSRGPICFEDLLQISLTGIIGAMNQLVASAPEEQKAEVKNGLYDMFNTAASRALEIFDPETEMRPDLTTDAIIKAQNDIIAAEYAKRKKDPSYESKYIRPEDFRKNADNG